MPKKILAIILTVVLSLLCAFSAFASPENGNAGAAPATDDITPGNTEEANASSVSQGEQTICVSGEDSEYTEPQYKEKLFYFTIDFNGTDIEAYVWLIKASAEENPKIKITDADENSIQDKYKGVIQCNSYTLQEEDNGYFVFENTSTGWAVNKRLLISNQSATVTGCTYKPDDVQHQIPEETSPKEETSKEDSKPVSGKDTEKKSKNTLKIVLIVVGSVLVVAAALATVLVLANFKKKNKTINSIKNIRSAVPSMINTQPENKRITVQIPVSSPKPIVAEFKAEVTAPRQERVVQPINAYDAAVVSEVVSQPAMPERPQVPSYKAFHEQIMRIYKGELSPDGFSGKVTPITLVNAYDLSVSAQNKPTFTINNDFNNSGYILIENKYVYINFYIYNASDFKLYSDLEYVDRIFNIDHRGYADIPYGRDILNIVPATMQIDGNLLQLESPGEITVVN